MTDNHHLVIRTSKAEGYLFSVVVDGIWTENEKLKSGTFLICIHVDETPGIDPIINIKQGGGFWMPASVWYGTPLYKEAVELALRHFSESF